MEKEARMQYLLLIYEPEVDYSALTQEEGAAEMEHWGAYGKWLEEKGWLVGGHALQPVATATTVRERDGRTITTDGPFAETKEQLGGYYLIDCETEEQAVEAASKIPSVGRGSVEVRPIMVFSES
jgi:hypothetical protein